MPPLKPTLSDMPPKQVIIFDFDGTIADTLEAIIIILNKLAPLYKFQPIDTKKTELLRNKTSREILKALKIPLFRLPFVARRAKRELGAVMPTIKPIPGMEEVIRELKHTGFTLGIISSNSEANIREFITDHQLDYFDFVISTGFFRKKRILKRTLKKLQYEADHVIYVGDETRDMIAARQAGVKVIGVTWGINSPETLEKELPTAVASTPKQLLSTIRLLSIKEHYIHAK